MLSTGRENRGQDKIAAMDYPKERREFQRLRLPVLIDGSFSGMPVDIAEIGLVSARVRHRSPLLVGTVGELSFSWDESPIVLTGKIVRSAVVSLHDHGPEDEFESGVQLADHAGESGERLRSLLTWSVAREIEKRTSPGEAEALPLNGDVLVRSRDAPFISFRLDSGGWRQARTFLHEQPDNGFTVAAGEEPEELALLRRTYAQSGAEGRELVRLFAELSVRERMAEGGERLAGPPRESE